MLPIKLSEEQVEDLFQRAAKPRLQADGRSATPAAHRRPRPVAAVRRRCIPPPLPAQRPRRHRPDAGARGQDRRLRTQPRDAAVLTVWRHSCVDCGAQARGRPECRPDWTYLPPAAVGKNTGFYPPRSARLLFVARLSEYRMPRLFVLLLTPAGCSRLARCRPAADGELPKLPLGLKPVPVPADNPLTPGKVELGKQLYFDPRLSCDDTVSCASCHDPKKGWSNGDSFATGVRSQVGGRSAPTIINAAYSRAAVLGRPRPSPRRPGPRARSRTRSRWTTSSKTASPSSTRFPAIASSSRRSSAPT